MRIRALILLLLVTLAGCTVSTSTSTGGLQATGLKFAEGKEGPDRSNATFKPGEKIFVLFQIEGFKKDDKGKLRVQEDLLVTGPDGKTALDKKNVLDLDMDAGGGSSLTANNEIGLPSGAPGGEYKVTLAVRDLVGSGKTDVNTKFKLDAPAAPSSPTATPAAVESSSKLTTLKLENVRFAEGKEGPEVPDATFVLGQPIYVLFQIKGFSTDTSGMLKVQEDLLVTGPDGSKVLDKKNVLDLNLDAAGGDSLTANNEITLHDDATAGDYRVTLLVHDRISGSDLEQEVKFSVQGASGDSDVRD